MALFYRTGTGHLLSISGLHLSGMFLLIYLFLNSIFYIWSWRRKSSYQPYFRLSMLFGLLAVLAYMLAIGFEVPRLRAFIMLLFTAVSFIFIMFRNKFVVLALAASIVLVVTPGAAYSYSFYYSFICVFAIFISPSKKNFNVCIMIFAFLIPLNLHSSGVLDLSSIFVNFIVIPIFVFIYFPVQAVLFGFFGTTILLMDKLTEYLIHILSFMDIFGAKIRMHLPLVDNVEAVLLYIVLIFAIFIMFRKYGLDRKKVLFIYVSFVSIAIFYSTYVYLRYLNYTDTIKVFNLSKPRRYNGSGDLILVSTGGFNILIDTGYGDISVKNALKELRRAKISSIDYLILSHKDVDHIGGLDYLINSSGLDVKKILVSPCMYSHRDGLYLKRRVHLVCNDSMLNLDKHRRVEFLHPSCTKRTACSNDTAIVSIMSMNDNKVIFTSDVPVGLLKKLPDLITLNDLSRTIFQFPHHCSSKDDPSGLFNSRPLLGFCTRAQELLKSGVRPDRYGFPVLMTGSFGNIEIKFRKEQIKISFQKNSKVYNFN